MTRSRPPASVDQHAATELELYLDNTYEMERRKKAYLQNVARKIIAGKYDPSKAWKLWLYFVEDGAKQYDVEHGSGGKRSGYGSKVGSLAWIDKPTREHVAREYAASEHAKIVGGEYGDLYVLAGRKPPKVPKAPKSGGARANPAWRKVGASGWQAKTSAGTLGVTYSASAGGYFGSTSKEDGPIFPTRKQAQAWAEQRAGVRSNRGRARRKNTGAAPSSVTVRANLWQDSFGNTYHKAYVSVNGKHVLTTPTTYGYGSQYEYTAYEALADKGIVKPLTRSANGSTEAPWRAYQEQGIAYDRSSTNVSRKKDL